jgi:hypothetical protein
MEFQTFGDAHMRIDQLELPQPIAPYLIITGDNTFLDSPLTYDFYLHCARNWKKVLVTLGNQEYERMNLWIPLSMQDHETLFKLMFSKINSIVGSEVLILIQNNIYDFPDTDFRFIGLTYWPTMYPSKQLYMNSNLPETQLSITLEGDILHSRRIQNIPPDWPVQLPDYLNSAAYPYTYTDFSLLQKLYATKKRPMQEVDYGKLKEDEDSFLDVALNTTRRCVVVTHCAPSQDLQLMSSDDVEYRREFFTRDGDSRFTNPLVAWICGHLHVPQIKYINTIPLYVNVKSLKL